MKLTQEQLENLAFMVTKTSTSELTCDEVMGKLASFIDVVRSEGAGVLEGERGDRVDLGGVDESKLESFRDVIQHLGVCPECCEQVVAVLRGL